MQNDCAADGKASHSAECKQLRDLQLQTQPVGKLKNAARLV
jgi:hypothetical protein